jgi:hypothetical protein
VVFIYSIEGHCTVSSRNSDHFRWCCTLSTFVALLSGYRSSKAADLHSQDITFGIWPGNLDHVGHAQMTERLSRLTKTTPVPGVACCDTCRFLFLLRPIINRTYFSYNILHYWELEAICSNLILDMCVCVCVCVLVTDSESYSKPTMWRLCKPKYRHDFIASQWLY